MKQVVPKELGGGEEPAFTKVDGTFGPGMQRAVERVQAAKKKLVTGVVDVDTWGLLMGAVPWPNHYDRLINVPAGFEGHGYTVASGDHDRTGITWGLIGFTLVQYDTATGNYNVGPLSAVLRRVYRNQRATFDAAFGEIYSKELAAALKLDKPAPPASTPALAQALHEFARPLSAAGGHRLLPQWQSAFETLGSSADVQQIQRDVADELYFRPAMALAKTFGDDYQMACERTQLFFLDVCINNGSLKPNEEADARKRIQKIIDVDPNALVADKLVAIAEAMVVSRKSYANDIRERKGTMAHGAGTVHGIFYRLDGWGIDLSEPGQAGGIPPLSHAAVHLNPEGREPLALAAAASALDLAEAPATPFLATGRFPEKTGFDLLVGKTTRAVSMQGLATVGYPLINSKNEEIHEAVQMAFRGKVAILAISGQQVQSNLPGGKEDVIVLQKNKKTYVGLCLKRNDQLLVIRQRERGSGIDESSVDVTGIRKSLSACQLVFLYTSLGVPQDKQRGSAPRWREWIKATGADPVILGWYGAIRPPSDDAGKTVADRILARLKALEPAADFTTLCAKYGDKLVELWGQACHDAFAGGKQKYLWYEQFLAGPALPMSGAAAIDRSGQAWVANPRYKNTPGEPAMVRGK